MLFHPARVRIIIAALLAIGMFPLEAEAIFLSDGEVLFGSIEKTATGEVSVIAYGSGEIRRALVVARTEADPKTLIGAKLEVILKDGSILYGILVDFDEELGIFVDLYFGILNLPFPVIHQIFLDQQKLSDENPISLSLGFTVLQPINSTLFGLSSAPHLTLESMIPGSKAVIVGESIDYFIMTYLPSDEVRYGIMNLSLSLRIRLIPLFTGVESTSPFSPYLQLGGGVAFVAVVDNRADAQNTNYGTLDAQARVELGFELRISPRFSLGACGYVYMILQELHPVWFWGGGLALRYSL
jgi:hypothetical protein